jgi:hypothetical protein
VKLESERVRRAEEDAGEHHDDDQQLKSGPNGAFEQTGPA